MYILVHTVHERMAVMISTCWRCAQLHAHLQKSILPGSWNFCQIALLENRINPPAKLCIPYQQRFFSTIWYWLSCLDRNSSVCCSEKQETVTGIEVFFCLTCSYKYIYPIANTIGLFWWIIWSHIRKGKFCFSWAHFFIKSREIFAGLETSDWKGPESSHTLYTYYTCRR